MLKDRYPVIHLTDGGEAVAREVVDDRGRLWWLPAKRSLNFRKRPYTG